jgi:hypothetical protein
LVVGHPDRAPVEPLSNVRCADARSAQIGGPNGISQCFQVSLYSGEPIPSSLARNLLSNDCWREALLNEIAEDRPQVSLVGGSPLLSCLAEGLTWEAGSPDWAFPAAPLSCKLPAPDSGEKVSGVIVGKVIGRHLLNVAVVNVTGGNLIEGRQGFEPLGGARVVLVVVDPPYHPSTPDRKTLSPAKTKAITSSPSAPR